MLVGSVGSGDNSLYARLRQEIGSLDQNRDGKISKKEAEKNLSIFTICQALFSSDKPVAIEEIAAVMRPVLQEKQMEKLKQDESFVQAKAGVDSSEKRENFFLAFQDKQKNQNLKELSLDLLS